MCSAGLLRASIRCHTQTPRACATASLSSAPGCHARSCTRPCFSCFRSYESFSTQQRVRHLSSHAMYSTCHHHNQSGLALNIIEETRAWEISGGPGLAWPWLSAPECKPMLVKLSSCCSGMPTSERSNTRTPATGPAAASIMRLAWNATGSGAAGDSLPCSHLHATLASSHYSFLAVMPARIEAHDGLENLGCLKRAIWGEWMPVTWDGVCQEYEDKLLCMGVCVDDRAQEPWSRRASRPLACKGKAIIAIRGERLSQKWRKSIRKMNQNAESKPSPLLKDLLSQKRQEG
jgi:hypothetical protein